MLSCRYICRFTRYAADMICCPPPMPHTPLFRYAAAEPRCFTPRYDAYLPPLTRATPLEPPRREPSYAIDFHAIILLLLALSA